MKHLALIAALLASLMIANIPAHATSAKSEPRPYTEIVLSEVGNNKEAADIARKVLAQDLASYKKLNNRNPLLLAQFIALGPDKPKDSIVVRIDHVGVCGSSGCRTVVLMPTGNERYRIVFDANLGRIFVNTREGHAYSDILAYVSPRPVEGFGVHFWSDKKGIYEFAGISRFK